MKPSRSAFVHEDIYVSQCNSEACNVLCVPRLGSCFLQSRNQASNTVLDALLHPSGLSPFLPPSLLDSSFSYSDEIRKETTLCGRKEKLVWSPKRIHQAGTSSSRLGDHGHFTPRKSFSFGLALHAYEDIQHIHVRVRCVRCYHFA